jgi:oligoribonuclease
VNKPEYLLWCDLETTGLSPLLDEILEIALVVTDTELKQLGYFHRVFAADINFADLDFHVRDMHDKNVLWLDVIKNGTDMRDLNWDAGSWLDEIITPPGEPRMTEERLKKVYLAGSSVHFDRGFLDAKDIFFHKKFSHRIFDVSVMRTMLKMWKPELLWPQNGTHRAMDDILDHIEEAKYYRKVLNLGT